MTEWREQDHPRHPAGTDRGGEFREKGVPGGWATAVAIAIRSPEQDLLDLVTRAEQVDMRGLAGGRVAATGAVTLQDTDGTHHELVSKIYMGFSSESMAAREVVVAAIGQALGARVPVTILDPDGGGGALYMELLDGQTALEYGGGSPLRQTIISGEQTFVGGDLPDYSLLTKFLDSPSGRRLGLLDLLIRNIDRHAGNWLIDEDGQVAGIDHSHVALHGKEGDHPWTTGTFTDGYLHEVERVDEDGLRLHTMELDPIQDLSAAEANQIRQRLVALFEREDIRQLLITANTVDRPPTDAQPFVDGLLRRWDRIAEKAVG